MSCKEETSLLFPILVLQCTFC